MGLTPADVALLQHATSVANAQLIDTAVAAGKYVWAAFGNQDGVGSGPTSRNCAAWMAQRCNAAYQDAAITQAFDAHNVNASIASFLITRPPIAFLGYGWESDQRDWNAAFLYQVGVPLGPCIQASPSRFTRAWTHGVASLDCDTFTGVVPAA